MPPICESELSLPPNSGYEDRRVRFLRYTKTGFKVVGLLELRERRRPSESCPWKVRPFHVTEMPFNIDRIFRLVKPVGGYAEGEDSEYQVGIGMVAGKPRSWCTCRAATKLGYCSHSQAVLELGLKRLLPFHPGLPYYSEERAHVPAGRLIGSNPARRPNVLPARIPGCIPVATLA